MREACKLQNYIKLVLTSGNFSAMFQACWVTCVSLSGNQTCS